MQVSFLGLQLNLLKSWWDVGRWVGCSVVDPDPNCIRQLYGLDPDPYSEYGSVSTHIKIV